MNLRIVIIIQDEKKCIFSVLGMQKSVNVFRIVCVIYCIPQDKVSMGLKSNRPTYSLLKWERLNACQTKINNSVHHGYYERGW